MSDVTRLPETARPNSPLSSAKGEPLVTARLIGVPNETQGREDRFVHLRGEVISQSAEGKLSIRTNSGEIEVQLPPNETQKQPLRFEKGQSVEIEIPPQKARARTQEAVNIRVKDRAASAEQNIAQQTAEPNKSAETPKAQPQNETAPQQTTIKITTPAYIPPEQAAQILKETIPAQQAIDPALVVQKLQGAQVRIDPFPAAELANIIKALPTTLVQSALPAQVQALAASIPLQIASEQQTMLAQNLPLNAPSLAQAATQNTLLNQFTTQDASTNISTGVATLLAPRQDSKQAPLIPFTENAMSLGQPLEIKSIFFIRPITTTVLPDGNFAAPSTTLASVAPEQPLNMTKPFTASIETLKLPDIALVAPAAKDAASIAPPLEAKPENLALIDTIKSVPSDKADRFAFDTKVLTQSKIGSIQAVVQAVTPNNLPVISFPAIGEGQPLQSFLLQIPLENLPAGTRLELTPQMLTQSAVGAGQNTVQGVQMASLPQPATFLTPESWPLMQDIMQSVAAAQLASTAASVQSALIPNAANPTQIGAAMLFVMAALKSGDLTNILNDRTQDILRRSGKGGLLSRLSDEGNIINRTHTNSAGQDWRALTIPMQWGQDVQKIALYYKGERDDEGEEGGSGNHTRFIFDLNLNRMGKVQLDGLFRDKRLDMIVRTQEPFSRAMQYQMKTGYADTMELSALAGDLAFQNDPQSWVKIQIKTDDQYKTQI